MTPVDVVVVGAGLMGAAAARSLARRGRSVVVVEQYTPGHPHGSSHGPARIVRRAYSDALYVQLTGAAFAQWAELEAASGTALIRWLGGIDFGPTRDVPRIAGHLATAGVPHEVLSARAAEERWPGMRFEGEVLFHPEAGTVDADAAAAAMLRLAEADGADVQTATVVRALTPAGDHVRLALGDGTTLIAAQVVVAAGAWLPGLLGHVVPLPPLRVVRQDVVHFARHDGVGAWPSVIHEASAARYHLAGGGAADDRKLGEHRTGGAEAVPGAGPVGVDPAARAAAMEYVRRWLPGLVPEPRDESTCLYTVTPSEDFLLDRVGPLTVCSPCSGHGAKFAPLIGELVAGAVADPGSLPPRFRLAAHRTAAGAVSL